MSKRKTNEEFLIELKQKNNQIIPQEAYINNSTRLLFRCLKCGYNWYTTPNSILCGSGCPNCSGVKKRTNVEFIQELAKISPDIEPLEPYPGKNKIPILCRCKNCNTEWRASPNNLLSKHHQCPNCSRIQAGLKQRKSNDAFIHELSIVSPTITPLEPYTTSQKRIKCLCQRCGHIWSATPNNLLDKKSRCPQCSKASTSIIEQIMFRSFSLVYGGIIISRDKKAIGKELDIYFPQLKLAIEFGAWFWHRSRIKKDIEKHELCKDKGIHLITIYEDCPGTIDEVLIGDYRLYQEELSNEADYHSTLQIIKSICMDYSIPSEAIKEQWSRIINESIDNVRKRDNVEFMEIMQIVSPSIILLEPYSTSTIKLLCKCSVCQHEWRAIPTTLIKGIGCPKCARTITGIKLRYTNEEFVARLSKINPGIEPLEPYETGIKPIRCLCKKCGNIWKARPSNLLNHKGCPECAKKENVEKHSKPIRCIETGVVYKSIADVLRQTGIQGVHKCAKGYQKTAGGYHWEYVEECKNI